MSLSPAGVILSNRVQAGEFTLRSRIWLHRHRCVSGDFCQPVFKRFNELDETACVLGRNEGVKIGESGPADRLHLSGGVEFHRAGPQRNHASIQRIITIAELLEVPQHLGFAVVGIEYGVSQNLIGTQGRCRKFFASIEQPRFDTQCLQHQL